MLHRFSRTEMLLGTQGLEQLRQSRVVVMGVGGVGSYAAEALARSGVGQLVLVDHDDICLTNLNRQVHALTSTVGEAKVLAMANRIKEINPKCQVEPVREFFSGDRVDEFLTGKIDYLLDCIDHVTAKLDLITHAVQRGIPLVCAMGAGNKLDPTAFQVADISGTHTCPLAKVIRRELRQRGIHKGVQVVFSTETPIEPKTQGPDCKTNCICPNKEEERWNCTHRRSVPGSVGFVPPVAGLIMASVVVRQLTQEGE